MSVSDGGPLDLGLLSDAVFSLYSSSVYFCARLLHNSLNAALQTLLNLPWFPAHQVYFCTARLPILHIFIILLSNHRFTSGVVNKHCVLKPTIFSRLILIKSAQTTRIYSKH